jgi:hypothetical protein
MHAPERRNCDERQNIAPLMEGVLDQDEGIGVWVADDRSPGGTAEVVRAADRRPPGGSASSRVTGSRGGEPL